MFQFEIFGIPSYQKQTRWCKMPGGHVRAYDPSSKDKERIQWQVKPLAPTVPLSCAVEMTLTFFIPIPKATSRMMRRQMINRLILPDKKPDFDNLAYLVTNALKNLVYDDDKRVCVCHIYKFYGEEPKTVIQVRPILTLEPVGYQQAE